MSEKSLTFLEIHLGDGGVQIGPKSIGGESTIDDGEPAVEAEEPTGCRLCGDGCPVCSNAGRVLGLLLLLGVLGAAAFAARKALGADLSDAEALDELAE